MIYCIKLFLNNLLVKLVYKYYRWKGYKDVFILRENETPDGLFREIACVGGMYRLQPIIQFKFHAKPHYDFFIDKNGKLYDANGVNVWINGCSGFQAKNRKPVNKKDKWDYRTYPIVKPFYTRKQAEKYIAKHNIKGEVFFYGGCGCCGCSYEDDDGTIKDVIWKQYWPRNKSKIKYAKQLRDYNKYVKRNKDLLNGQTYLYYGENIKR